MSELADRVRDALMRRAPEIGVSSWRAKHAAEIDSYPETFEKWMRAHNPTEPSASALLALFDHFGEDFEAEVRGRAVERSVGQLTDQLVTIAKDIQRKAGKAS